MPSDLTLDVAFIRRGNILGLAGLGVRVIGAGNDDRIRAARVRSDGRLRVDLEAGGWSDAADLILLEAWPFPSPPTPQRLGPDTPWARYPAALGPRSKAGPSTPPAGTADPSSPA